VSNASWGTKRSCPKCAARFYDLAQHPAQCPKCNHSFDPAAMLKPRRGRARKFSNVTPETEADDALFNSILAKAGAGKGGKKSKEDIDDIKDDVLVEDAEDIEEFDSIGELEGASEKSDDGDEADEGALMEDFEIEGEEIIDDIEDEEVDDEDEEADADEDDAPKSKRRR
jgi:hypothetical protein